MTGFYTQTFGAFVFKALWEHLTANYKIKPAVSSKSWKMNFTIEKADELDSSVEGFSDEEDCKPITESADVEVVIKSVIEDEDGDQPPTDMYVDFRRTAGSHVVFGNFFRGAMREGRLEMFRTEAPADEEEEDNEWLGKLFMKN